MVDNFVYKEFQITTIIGTGVSLLKAAPVFRLKKKYIELHEKLRINYF